MGIEQCYFFLRSSSPIKFIYISYQQRSEYNRHLTIPQRLQAVSGDAAGRVLDVRRQTVVVAQNALHESLGHGVGTGGAGVGVVVGEEGVDLGVAEALVDVGDVRVVVDVGGAGADVLSSDLGVADEARRRVDEGASLPEVVWRLRGDDDLGALGREGLAGVGHVGDEGLHDLAVGRGASLRASAGAVAAAVVGRGGGATVLEFGCQCCVERMVGIEVWDSSDHDSQGWFSVLTL